MTLRIGALALAVSLVTGGVAAQDRELRPFCPDRPGKGDSTCVIDPGVIQVEVGLFDGFEQEDAATRVEGWAAGSVTVRYGVGPRTEVQAGVSLATREEATDRATGLTDTAEGIGDLFLAMRHSLINPDGEPFGMAVTVFGTVPTGGDEVRASGIEAGVALPMAFDTGSEWSLGISPFVEAIRDADGEGSHAAYSLVIGTDRGFGDWTLGGRGLDQPRRRPGGLHDPVHLRPHRRLEPAVPARRPAGFRAQLRTERRRAGRGIRSRPRAPVLIPQ
jgi:hypothetical protein